jgi:uncharacterized membrane protein YfcA
VSGALLEPSFLACALAVMAGALLQGTGGIGFAMLAAPVAALLRPELVPGPMILMGGLVSLLIAVREARSIDYRSAAIAVGGRVPGSIVAGLVIGLLPRTVFAIAFAALILAAVALSIAGWRVRATPASLVVAGFGSGFMGTLTSVGAPPMGIVMQNMASATLRATLAAFLVVSALVSLAVLAAAGRFGAREIHLGLLLAAPMAAGFALSTPLARRVQAHRVRSLVLAISGISALVLLAQNVRIAGA